MIKTDAFRACRHRSILCIFRLLLRADRPVRALVVGRRPLLPFLALSACLSFLFSSSLTLVLLATQPEEKRTGGARPPSQPIGRVGGSANIARPFFCSLLSATSVCPRDSQSLCLYERILASLCISLMSSFFFLLFFFACASPFSLLPWLRLCHLLRSCRMALVECLIWQEQHRTGGGAQAQQGNRSQKTALTETPPGAHGH